MTLFDDRKCADCDANIGYRHGTARRCEDCATIRRKSIQKKHDAKKREVTVRVYSEHAAQAYLMLTDDPFLNIGEISKRLSADPATLGRAIKKRFKTDFEGLRHRAFKNEWVRR
jgi:hypothetical protein